MTIVADTIAPPCAAVPEVFDHEQLHSPPARTSVTAAEWTQLTAIRAAAHRQCAGCPVMVECLYRAVVEVDVSGFVACTTESDRQQIRRQLGIQVSPPLTPPYGGPRVGGSPVSHEAVMAIREAYPRDTCQQLADRLGCSMSTIKRHLRRSREAERGVHAVTNETSAHPTIADVLDAFDQLESSRVA